MFWRIGMIFSMIMTAGGVLALIVEKGTEPLFVLPLFVLFDIISYRKYRDIKSGKADERKEKAKEIKDLRHRTILGKHQAGLPLPQDSYCTILIEDSCFKITGGGNEFRLDKGKITEMCVKTDVEIQRQYVSSSGGAVAGAMVFGALGAIVGGRVKEKTNRTYTYYLIFTYRSNDEINYVSFEIDSVYKAGKWCREIQNRIGGNSQNPTIEL